MMAAMTRRLAGAVRLIRIPQLAAALRQTMTKRLMAIFLVLKIPYLFKQVSHRWW